MTSVQSVHSVPLQSVRSVPLLVVQPEVVEEMREQHQLGVVEEMRERHQLGVVEEMRERHQPEELPETVKQLMEMLL